MIVSSCSPIVKVFIDDDPFAQLYDLHFLQTAAFEVFSAIRNSSWWGIMLIVGTALLLIGVAVAVTVTKRGRNAEGVVADKIVVRYVETGEVPD